MTGCHGRESVSWLWAAAVFLVPRLSGSCALGKRDGPARVRRLLCPGAVVIDVAHFGARTLVGLRAIAADSPTATLVVEGEALGSGYVPAGTRAQLVAFPQSFDAAEGGEALEVKLLR